MCWFDSIKLCTAGMFYSVTSVLGFYWFVGFQVFHLKKMCVNEIHVSFTVFCLEFSHCLSLSICCCILFSFLKILAGFMSSTARNFIVMHYTMDKHPDCLSLCCQWDVRLMPWVSTIICWKPRSKNSFLHYIQWDKNSSSHLIHLQTYSNTDSY